MDIAIGLAILALAAQFGAIVWGASQVKSSVDQLKTSVDNLSEFAKNLDSRIDNHEVRISLLDQKLENL
jgi:hypothetical protein